MASSVKKRGLGMGLSALLAGEDAFEPVPGESLRQIPIERLAPSPLQPRRRFDPDDLKALALSIRAKGVLQPLVVREGDDGYEIVAGERRWRAAQTAGLHALPAIVRRFSDQETLEIALIENLQRADLSAIEEARAFERLLDEFGHTQEALANALAKSRSHVANTLRLLKLPTEVQAMVEDGRLSAGHARALIGVEHPLEAARAAVERGLTVRDVEALAATGAAVKRSAPAPPAPDLADCEARLAARLGLKVAIKSKRRGGTLTIAYGDLDQLQAIIGFFESQGNN